VSGTRLEASSERSFYHRFAWAYDLLIERPGGPQLVQVPSVLREHGVDSGSHVIDAGCGTGSYAVALAESDFIVTAVERSPELLAEAEHRAVAAGASISFVHADITQSWAPDVLADGVLCRGVLNDLRSDDARRRAFHAFARWLRPGGALLLDVRETERSYGRYRDGRDFTRTARRGADTVTFRSITTMEADSELLDLRERWHGLVDGKPVEHEERFAMRTWSWRTLQDLARASGFSTVTRLPADTVGARDDRIVALAMR
jgi:ubiquinone/menaquinone biosynthesis C-methylase UbiE